MEHLTGKIGRHPLVALALCMLLASSGCSSFIAPARKPSVVAEATGASCTVEYHPYRQKGWQKKISLAGPANVSDAIKQAKASKKLSRMKISVIRNVRATNRTVAMTVMTEGKRVAANTDYALHDGDRIVIKEDASGPIDQMMGIMPELF